MSEIAASAYEKTNKLASAGAGAGADFVLANQSAKDKKMTLTQLATFISTNVTNLTVTLLSATTGNITTLTSTTVSATNINLTNDLTITEAGNMILGTSNGTQIGTASGQKVGFFGVTPVVKAAALTAAASAITHTAPGTPDAAIQDLVSTAASFGYATKDEGNTVLRNIVTMQTEISELKTVVQNLGLAN